MFNNKINLIILIIYVINYDSIYICTQWTLLFFFKPFNYTFFMKSIFTLFTLMQELIFIYVLLTYAAFFIPIYL